MTYVYLGDVFSAQGNQQQAAVEYQHALASIPAITWRLKS